MRNLLFSFFIFLVCQCPATQELVVFTKVVPAEVVPAEENSISELPSVLRSLLKRHSGQPSFGAKGAIESHRHFFSLFDPHKIYLLASEVDPFFHNGETYAKQLRDNSFSAYFEMLDVCKKAIKRAQKTERSLNIKRSGATQTLPRFETYATSQNELQSRISLSLLSSIAANTRSQPTLAEWRKAKQLVEKERRSHQELWLSLSATGENEALLVRFILESLVSTFDVHSKVMDARQARFMRERLTKQGLGTGISAKRNNGSWFISHITKGSPADAIGTLQAKDVLIAINHLPCSKMSRDEIDSYLHAEEETTVHIKIERPANKTKLSTSIPSRLYSILEGRASIKTRSTQQGPIAIATVPSLYRGSQDRRPQDQGSQDQKSGEQTSQDQGFQGPSTENDLQVGLEKAQAEGALSGLILDLRGNRGGYIAEAAKVVGLFVSTGVVLSAVYQDESHCIFRDYDRKIAYNGPIIVLISHTTASSAEIVAQALVDYGRAIVVGDKVSYGKGSVQMQTVTKKADALPMKMTVGKLYTVSGVSPQGRGVQADIVISRPGPTSFKGRSREQYEDIEPLFDDPLEDISKKHLGWYQKHYLPYLQAPTDKYRKLIPQLRKEYAKRNHRPPSPYLKTKGVDHQLEEAINILQNIIRLSGKS